MFGNDLGEGICMRDREKMAGTSDNMIGELVASWESLIPIAVNANNRDPAATLLRLPP